MLVPESSPILPDVLRSGSRYTAWRACVEAHARLGRLQLLGQFDRWADVDVFSLELQVSRSGPASAEAWGYPVLEVPGTVRDHFVVSVGRVVPYRDEERGPRYRYIHARNLPPWQVDSKPREWRRHTGEPFKPPFVVVRRTSRAGQTSRSVGTIVIGEEPVAVENHLLVLAPIDGTVARCQQLLEVLRSPRSNEWFDQRIRCRHLTAAALRQLPWWDDNR